MKKKVTMTEIDFDTDTQCTVARTAGITGDHWSLLVLRELFAGSHRFDDIQAMTGATPQMVTSRLKRLEAGGLVYRQRYSERPPRYEYHLTEKGADFFPVMMALRAWGETWLRLPGEDPSVEYTHLTCGHSAGFGPLCDHCAKPLKREELQAAQSRAAKAERDALREAFKKGRVRKGIQSV